MEKTLKKLNRPWMIFFITLGILVLVLIILIIVYAKPPDLEQLVEEYAKFLGGIVSMLLGFFLVNVLWDQRMKTYQTGRFKKILAHFYSKINNFSKQIKQLLAKDFLPEKTEENQQRDHRIQELQQKLRSLGQGIENYAPEAEMIEDEVIRNMAVDLWTEIQTNLARLPVGQDFRTDMDEFEETIDALIATTERAMELLRS